MDVSPLTVTFVIGFLAETPIRNMPVLMSLCEIKSKVKLGVKNQENPFFGTVEFTRLGRCFLDWATAMAGEADRELTCVTFTCFTFSRVFLENLLECFSA